LLEQYTPSDLDIELPWTRHVCLRYQCVKYCVFVFWQRHDA